MDRKEWEKESLKEARESLIDFLDRGNIFYCRGKNRNDILGVCVLAIQELEQSDIIKSEPSAPECKCEPDRKGQLPATPEGLCGKCGLPIREIKCDEGFNPKPQESRKIELLKGIDSYKMADKINEITERINK